MPNDDTLILIGGRGGRQDIRTRCALRDATRANVAVQRGEAIGAVVVDGNQDPAAVATWLREVTVCFERKIGIRAPLATAPVVRPPTPAAPQPKTADDVAKEMVATHARLTGH